MTITHPFEPSTATQRFVGPKARPGMLAVLTDADRRQLEGHLRGCEPVKVPFLSKVLDHKIRFSASSDGSMTDDVVTGGSRVIYAIAGGPVKSGQLCHATKKQANSGVIPVASLLGVTLIGMQVGQRAPLLQEDGTIVSLSVLGVTRAA